MKKTNLSWVGALLVFALLLWCTAATPGKIDDPSTYTCAVYSSALSLLPPVVAIVLALNTKEVYTSLLVGIATGALLYANANAATAFNTTNEYATLYDLRMSEHFTLRNLALSGAVIRHRIANVPTAEETERLRALCENVLEPLRRRFGVIRVVNGYHSEELCRLTGSDNTSQHRLGEETDIHVSSMEVAQKMYDFIKANLVYDQLRLEAKPKTCTIILHVSYKVVRG